MSTTHIGKIGRLPKDTRHILGERIEDGVPNKELVKWLNEGEEVKWMLEQRFGGRAITEQNLSEWKHTGHMEWLRREERRALALQLTEQRDEESMEPDESVAEKEISDRLGRELGMEMARLALALVEQEGDTETRWKRLCEVNREVSQLRRDDHRAERTRIARERWKHELEQEEMAAAEQERKAHKQQLLEVIRRPAMAGLMAESFGGGKHGETMAELALRIQADEDLKSTMEWFQEAQKEWVTPPSKPQCSRAGKVKVNDEGTGVRPPDPELGESSKHQHPTSSEAPSANHQRGEAHGAADASESEEIRMNPSKSNRK